ncbi:MAG: glycosyltransferase family 4 protein [Planctomycetota bacterium]
MKLLHLFSNHKVTGPAEPAIRLAAELAGRGHEVVFAHKPLPKPGEGYIDSAAANHGLTTNTDFRLPKHFKPFTILGDARRLAAFIDERGFDIVHCNLLNDHLTGALAARRSRRKPKIVRTNHAATRMDDGLRERFLFPKRTDALIELSERAREQDIPVFRLPAERVFMVDTAIEIARFDPGRELPDMRTKLGLTHGDFVVGIAARIQKQRRFGVLLDAVAIARERVPNLKLVIIGRGTHKEKVAVRPARKRGLGDLVIFPGYLRGDEYVAALLALDVKIFLFPGTDGSCRAAREAMALGRPVIAAKRGMLPELIDDGETGLVIDDSPQELADAIVRLADDSALRGQMGSAARAAARARFDPACQAERVEQIYKQLL